LVPWGRRINAAPCAPRLQPYKDQDMAVESNREREIFRLVAGTMMVVLILFGLLELMDVIHI
jgi:hypothetical protein